VANFNPLHLHLSPLYGVIQFEFRRDLWRQKTRVPRLTLWHYLRHPIFIRFDTVPECDRQTDRQAHDDGIYRASIASCCKMQVKIKFLK